MKLPGGIHTNSIPTRFVIVCGLSTALLGNWPAFVSLTGACLCMTTVCLSHITGATATATSTKAAPAIIAARQARFGGAAERRANVSTLGGRQTELTASLPRPFCLSRANLFFPPTLHFGVAPAGCLLFGGAEFEREFGCARRSRVRVFG